MGMERFTHYKISCDGCEVEGVYSESAERAIEIVQEKDWLKVGDLWLCPRCRKVWMVASAEMEKA